MVPNSTLRASLSGTFLQGEKIVNHCLEFDQTGFLFTPFGGGATKWTEVRHSTDAILLSVYALNT